MHSHGFFYLKPLSLFQKKAYKFLTANVSKKTCYFLLKLRHVPGFSLQKTHFLFFLNHNYQKNKGL
jgi:hypothetical protein